MQGRDISYVYAGKCHAGENTQTKVSCGEGPNWSWLEHSSLFFPSVIDKEGNTLFILDCKGLLGTHTLAYFLIQKLRRKRFYEYGSLSA
jgi:hypothetical protein